MEHEIAKPQSGTGHSYDFAKEEFERFAERCGVRLTTDGEKEDLEDREFCDQIIGYIQKGWLVIDDDGKGTYKLRHPNVRPVAEIVFDEPDGVQFKALDKMKGEAHVAGLIAFMAAVAGVPAKLMVKIKKRDYDVAKDICTLFLG
jgi:hypothetical protein